MKTSSNEAYAEQGVSRRGFLTGAGVAGVAAAAAATGLAGGGTAMADEAEESSVPVTEELGYPGEEETPEVTSYECDVLVVGAGFAGLHAAVRAARAGASVICMDKGKPGYSGLAPFAGGTTNYDPETDNIEGSIKTVRKTGDYTANLDYLRMYIEAIPDAYELNQEFGFMVEYNDPETDGYDSSNNDGTYDYYSAYRDIDRHALWESALTDNGVTVLDHTMLVDLVTDAADEQRVTGAVAFQFRSSTVVTVACKACVLATGPGGVKPTGYPTSGNTFDGEYICYNLGLPIVGKEYDDFHQTCSYAAGDMVYTEIWDYVEPFSTGDTFNMAEDDETVDSYASGKGSYMVVNRVNQALTGAAAEDGTSHKHTLYGSAAGMNAHMCTGVFCGWDDFDGYTGIPGLYVAGDGMYGCMMLGSMYSAIFTTSSGCSVQGDRSGTAAAAYAATVDAVAVPQEKIDEVTEEIFYPSTLTKGFDPNWARDQLQATMVAPQVHLARNEATLTAALTEVEWLRDRVVPLLMGYTGHDLRLCLEMKHKVLACELKLRVQLARQESRGMHYRIDYPYRDDENFLCHMAIRKGDDGDPVIEKVDLPDDWKGDVDEDYTSRYLWRFPGEADALGLEEE